MKKKKLQVFISSTYTDLRTERQAAVQAVLSSGHIPAGMELFTAGDETQMKVIKRWIEESDIYLLILGGRYGSVEPITGKSYTHLEYEYAIEKNKPFFAVVISENAQEKKIKEFGSVVVEPENPKLLKEFRKVVLTKLVKFFEDSKDIKLAIHETMSEFARRENLVGWVRASEDIDTGNLAEEIARLTRENSTMRSQLANGDQSDKFETLGLNIDEIVNLLKGIKIEEKEIPKKELNNYQKVSQKLEDEEINLFHFFWINKESLADDGFDDRSTFDEYVYKLREYGLATNNRQSNVFKFSTEGRKFYLKCLVKFNHLRDVL